MRLSGLKMLKLSYSGIQENGSFVNSGHYLPSLKSNFLFVYVQETLWQQTVLDLGVFHVQNKMLKEMWLFRLNPKTYFKSH